MYPRRLIPRVTWRRSADEEGIALVTVIGISSVMAILLTAVLAASVNALRGSRRTVAYSAAEAAAESGIDDFLFRINADPEYWKKASQQYDGSSNPTRDSAAGNPAYYQFVAVPGSANGALYTYQAAQDVQRPAGAGSPTGTVTLTSTGLVDGSTRTVRATLRRDSFLDYLYLSEYETRPPQQYETWPSSDEDNENNDRDGQTPELFGEDAIERARRECVFYRYEDRRATPDGSADPTVFWDGRNADCHEPHWTSDDFNGPYHTNDMIPVRNLTGAGMSWNRQPTTTAWGAGEPTTTVGKGFLDVEREINNRGNDSRPSFPYPASADGRVRPRWHQPINLPPNNRELGDQAALGGYVFYGPTRVVLQHDSLWVSSPASGGRHGLPASGKGTLPLPGNGVIYVRNGTSRSCSPTTNPADRPPLGAGTTVNGIQALDYLDRMYPGNDPAQYDYTRYSCWAGDAYLEGELKGRLTVGAESDVYVTWHLGYASSPRANTSSGYANSTSSAAAMAPSSDRDLLGIVADGAVKLFKPVKCKSYLLRSDGQPNQQGVCGYGTNIGFHNGKTIQNLTIYGSILAVNDAMRLSSQMIGGGVGRLYVFGSIAQRFRGNLGSANGNSLPAGGNGVPSDCKDRENGSITDALTSAGSGRCRTRGGFGKSFGYDERLQYISPPYFLAPLAVSWSPRSFEERQDPPGLPPKP